MATLQQIENILPQTQCGECGYSGCAPYAEALLIDDIAINRCRPGGDLVINKLAKLLDKPVIRASLAPEPISAANILKSCIGCTLCIQACPTGCITGSARKVHTVNMQNCTGCKLCVKICPEDCIDIIPNPEFLFVKSLPANKQDEWHENRRNIAHQLFILRNAKNAKKIKSKNKSKNKVNSLSEEHISVIIKAREESKKKYAKMNKQERKL